MNNQNKFFKNPERTIPSYQPYVPQYKILDKEPIRMDPSGGSIMSKSTPRPKFTPQIIPKQNSKQPFAEVGSVLQKPLDKFPNIGNNEEMSWSSFGQSYVDEHGNQYQIDPNLLIDNNEYINYPNNGKTEIFSSAGKFDELKQSSDIGNYLLFIDESWVSSGTLDKIEKEVKKLVFGEHPLGEVNPDRISVFKKVNVKVGVFIGE
jgi:hypothetical protein